jgi:hypothetical protein
MAFAKTTWVQNALPADTATQKNRIESAIDDLYNSGIRKAAGAFRAWNAAGAGTTVPASVANPGTKIACDSEQNDVSGWYDPAQSRFTPQLAGIYWLVHRVNTTQVLASGTNVEARIVQNTGGAAQKVNANRSQASNATSGVYAEVTALFFFNGTTDFAEPFAWHDYSGGARGIGGDFMGFFVGTL